METPKVLYSRKEAASALSLGVRTLDQLICSGELSARRVGRRVLISRESIIKFAESAQHNLYQQERTDQ
jgi:excisionase family DNA binding protein